MRTGFLAKPLMIIVALASLSATSRAASAARSSASPPKKPSPGMAGMKMPGPATQSAGKSTTGGYVVRASVTPNPPVVDVNTLDLQVSGPDGKPATGLKLQASVFMTSMDMGTAHPKVKELGGGRYRVAAEFAMKGPWRVAVAEAGSGKGKPGRAVVALDFMAGSKAKWAQPDMAPPGKPLTGKSSSQPTAQKPPTDAPTVSDSNPSPVNPPLDSTAPADQRTANEEDSNPNTVTPTAPTASTSETPTTAETTSASETLEAVNSEPGANMPVPGKGSHEGSEYGGGHDALANPLTAQLSRLVPKQVVTVKGDEDWESLTGFGPNESMVGMMTLMMVGGSGMEGMKMAPMKPGSMAGMDMSDGGGMAGMDMSGKGGAKAAPSGYRVKATVNPNPPAVDVNTIDLAITGPDGRPAAGLKLNATVAMTSMDMGTARPKVEDLGQGRYRVAAEFTMKGSWRVAIAEAGPGKGKPGKTITALDFSAGSKAKWSQLGMAPMGQPSASPTSTRKVIPEDSMAGMDMGTDKGQASEPNDAGTAEDSASQQETPETSGSLAVESSSRLAYSASPARAPAPASAAKAAASSLMAGSQGWVVTAHMAPSPPAVGDNMLDIVVKDASGKPVTGIKLSAIVAMTGMDMGTARPAIREMGSGHYAALVTMTMPGPWRVTVGIPGGPSRPFLFTVQR
jgi:hypothetical protein